MLIALAPGQNTPDLSRAKVQEIGKKAAETKAKVIGFTEVREVNDKIDLQKGLGPDYAFAGLDSTIPIAYKYKRLQTYPTVDLPDGIKSMRTILIHKGDKELRTPRRFITYVILATPAGPVAFINTHWYNVQHKPEGQHLWDLAYDMTTELVIKFRKHGISSVLMGDFNKVHLADIHPHFLWETEGGICRIGTLEGLPHREVPKVHFEIKDFPTTFKTPADHNGRLVSLTLS